jgi:exoribonuclease-2
MIREKSLAIYKNRPALVDGIEGDKINICVLGEGGGAELRRLKVREKDIEILHPGPCSLSDLDAPAPAGNVREAWELLADAGAGGADAAADAGASGGELPLKELAELAFGGFTPRAAWAAYQLLREGLYFTGTIEAIRARPASELEGEEKKRGEKQREAEERAAFLERLKRVLASGGPAGSGGPEGLPQSDRRFLQDVEALARGLTDKSRTLKELGRGETPQEAHRLLLSAGIWSVWENPHPWRFGLSLGSAKIIPEYPAGLGGAGAAGAGLGGAEGGPSDKGRRDLTHLAAWAIDNAWSDDPDDAVSLEGPDSEGRFCLWVHVADPAAAIPPDSPADIEARGRGATLYLPEGAFRMLAPETLPLFALGLSPASPALSFKILLNKDLSIAETAIVPSVVKVARLSYEAADELAGAELAPAGLAGLFDIAARNVERRLDSGAVLIELPEAHIKVRAGGGSGENRVFIEAQRAFKSAEMVRECMVLAGEGAAAWALQNQVPFPFISQEAGDLPAERLSGLAGAWQLRRCMRPRSLSVKPGVHWGLGLDSYTQVTSPLRRYTDLLAHQQIRAFLGGEKVLSEDEILFRVSAAEAAASAVSRAERASRAHWIAVYLSDKKDSVWEGILLDRKGNRGQIIIPALGLETQAALKGSPAPNDSIQLILRSVNIPAAEAVFVSE